MTIHASTVGALPKPVAVAAIPGLSRLTLSNGLTVFLLSRARAPLVSLRLQFSRGSAVVPAGKSGLADLTAQLLRRGTERHSAEAIDEMLEGAGTDLGVSVSDDSTCFTLTAEPPSAPRLFGLLGELLRLASFPKQEVTALRERTCDQLKASLDDAEWVATRAAYRTVFAGHPYGVPSEGWSSELAGLGRKDVRAFGSGFFGRGACLVLAGAVTEPLDVLLRPFLRLPAGPEPANKLSVPPALRGRHVVIVDKPDATQAQIRLVGTGLRRGAADLIPAILGNGVLGDGFSSRLVNEVRVNRGLTYGISSRFGALEVGGLFAVRSFTRLDKVSELVQVVIDQMSLLRDEGPSEEELSRVRTYLGGAYRIGTETPEQVGAHTADAFRYGLGDDWLARYPRLLGETPREAVGAALRAYLPVEKLRVVAVGPAVKLERQLKRFGSVEVIALRDMA